MKGLWNELKGKLKQQYGNHPDDDLVFSEGQKEELLGSLQKKLVKNKEKFGKRSRTADDCAALHDDCNRQ